MHTARELSSPAFSIRVEGRAGVLDDVFPDFAERDRLGVVVRHPCGAIGASTLILAAVTAFYDAQRAKGEDFFIYPDYFLFHVGARLGDHGMLDVWPAHKEVVVPDEPEELLRAINDPQSPDCWSRIALPGSRDWNASHWPAPAIASPPRWRTRRPGDSPMPTCSWAATT